MKVLSAQDAEKLSKIAGRVESPHDGEALNAARMLIKRLGGHGIRLSDLIERGLRAEIEPVYVHSFAAWAYPSPPLPAHAKVAQDLLNDLHFRASCMSHRSAEFLVGIKNAPSLTAKQQEWLDDLVAKAERLRAGRAAA